MSPNTRSVALAFLALSASTLANPVERRHMLSDDLSSAPYCPAPVTVYITVTPTMTIPIAHPTSVVIPDDGTGGYVQPGKPSYTGGSGPEGSSTWDLTSASGEPPLATGDFSTIVYTTVGSGSSAEQSTAAESATTTVSGNPSTETWTGTGTETEINGEHPGNPTYTVTLSNLPVETSVSQTGSENNPSHGPGASVTTVTIGSGASATTLTIYPEPTGTIETISGSNTESAAATSTTPCPEESGSGTTTTPCPESTMDHDHTHTNPTETPCPESESGSATNAPGATMTTTVGGETTKTPCPESDSPTTTTPCPESTMDHQHTHTNPTETPCPESETATNAPTSPPQPTNTHMTMPPYPTNTDMYSVCPTPSVVYSTLTATTTIIATVTSFPGSWTTSVRRY